MKLEGKDREAFMKARAEATGASNYYRTPEEAFERERSHLPLIPLGWCDADFDVYKPAFDRVKQMHIDIQVISRDAHLVMKEMLGRAEDRTEKDSAETETPQPTETDAINPNI